MRRNEDKTRKEFGSCCNGADARGTACAVVVELGNIFIFLQTRGQQTGVEILKFFEPILFLGK